MINRIELKAKAKEVLRRENTYWISFAVCLLVAAIPNLLSVVTLPINMTPGSFSHIGNFFYSNVRIILISGILILQCVFSIFLIMPLSVGQKRFFIKSAAGDNSFSALLDIFKSETYMNTVKILFFKNLYIFLWGLFYIIPYSVIIALIYIAKLNPLFIYLSFIGIIPLVIKYYSYFMIDYIVAENPLISRKEAFAKSKEMMKSNGYKTFLLQLSFFGWVFLGAMLCGIGVVFVVPYMEATMTQLYLKLKNKDNMYEFCYEQ